MSKRIHSKLLIRAIVVVSEAGPDCPAALGWKNEASTGSHMTIAGRGAHLFNSL
jgi:hypothetical protein